MSAPGDADPRGVAAEDVSRSRSNPYDVHDDWHLCCAWQDGYDAALAASEADRAALERRVAELEAALRPFAEACGVYRWPDHDDYAPVRDDSGVAFRLHELRAAARALTPGASS